MIPVRFLILSYIIAYVSGYSPCTLCANSNEVAPNPNANVFGTTCQSYAEQASSYDENSETCGLIQYFGGLYCGCSYPIPNPPVCSLCYEDNQVLVKPSNPVSNEDTDLTCGQVEFMLNVNYDGEYSTSASCNSVRKVYSSTCKCKTVTAPSPTKPPPTSRPTSSLPTTSISTSHPINKPSVSPTHIPSTAPSNIPTLKPSEMPTLLSSYHPSHFHSANPSIPPSISPSFIPSNKPSTEPSTTLSSSPSLSPSNSPSSSLTNIPSLSSSSVTTGIPTKDSSESPSSTPSHDDLSSSPSIPIIATDEPTWYTSHSSSQSSTFLSSDQPSQTQSQIDCNSLLQGEVPKQTSIMEVRNGLQYDLDLYISNDNDGESTKSILENLEHEMSVITSAAVLGCLSEDLAQAKSSDNEKKIVYVSFIGLHTLGDNVDCNDKTGIDDSITCYATRGYIEMMLSSVDEGGNKATRKLTKSAEDIYVLEVLKQVISKGYLENVQGVQRIQNVEGTRNSDSLQTIDIESKGTTNNKNIIIGSAAAGGALLLLGSLFLLKKKLGGNSNNTTRHFRFGDVEDDTDGDGFKSVSDGFRSASDEEDGNRSRHFFPISYDPISYDSQDVESPSRVESYRVSGISSNYY